MCLARGKRLWVLLHASPARGVTSLWLLPSVLADDGQFCPGAARAVVATVRAQAEDKGCPVLCFSLDFSLCGFCRGVKALNC